MGNESIPKTDEQQGAQNARNYAGEIIGVDAAGLRNSFACPFLAIHFALHVFHPVLLPASKSC